MLMIWLQGIWLPQHGYDYTVTPLWAGIYMIPFSVGFVVYVLLFAIAMSLVAAVASALRGEKFIHEDEESRAQKAVLAGVGGEVSSLAEGEAPLAGAGSGAAGGLGADGAEGSAGVTSGVNSPPPPPSDASGPTDLGPTDLGEPALSGRPRRRHRRRGGRASHPGRGTTSTG